MPQKIFFVLFVIPAKGSPLMEIGCRLMAFPQELILRMFRELRPHAGKSLTDSQCPTCVSVVDVTGRKDKCGLDDIRKSWL
mgnify:FL=1